MMLRARKGSSKLKVLCMFGAGSVAFLTIIYFITNGMDVLCKIRQICSAYDAIRPNKHSPFDSMNEMIVVDDTSHITETDFYCTYWSCIDSYKCVENFDGKISVYVYDVKKYVDSELRSLLSQPSKEHIELIWVISQSRYATTDPSEACIFVPSVDLLNQKHLNRKTVARILASLPFWNNGSNHLLFNMVPSMHTEARTLLAFPHGKAIVAGADFTQMSYRRSFDVSIPFYNPHQDDSSFINSNNRYSSRPWLIVSAQLQYSEESYKKIQSISSRHGDVLVLLGCKDSNRPKTWCDANGSEYLYPSILTQGKYCLMTRQRQLTLLGLCDALRAGCVPVVCAQSLVMPYSEVLDWKRAAVFVNEDRLDSLAEILTDITNDRDTYTQLQQQGRFFYENYFKMINQTALTVLNIINSRALPHRALSYDFWNRLILPAMSPNPFIIPLVPSSEVGFTAMILGYDRPSLVKQVIQQITKTKHVSKIIIVWNNQKLKLVIDLSWPKTTIPVKVIETKQNYLSNRFYPYGEIVTDCVLTIDDDIVMVPPEELDFAYQVWTENQDRLVGFPPRFHAFNNSGWYYDSEWGSNISMVLTGVAFSHKYYHYLYTSSMPSGVKQWIDDHMNCEDVAMNFLIAKITGKAPIKVLARKKFKVTSGGISAGILSHLVERNKCMKVFAEAFGLVPLRTTEFRADPVLYKVDAVPEILKLYPSNGGL